MRAHAKSGITNAEAKAVAERLVSALGPEWSIFTFPLSGRHHIEGAVLAKILRNGYEFATGWTWPNLLETYCWRSSMTYGPWEKPPRVRASSIEELRLKLAVLG